MTAVGDLGLGENYLAQLQQGMLNSNRMAAVLTERGLVAGGALGIDNGTSNYNFGSALGDSADRAFVLNGLKPGAMLDSSTYDGGGSVSVMSLDGVDGVDGVGGGVDDGSVPTSGVPVNLSGVPGMNVGMGVGGSGGITDAAAEGPSVADARTLRRGERLFASMHRASVNSSNAADDPRSLVRDPLMDIAR